MKNATITKLDTCRYAGMLTKIKMSCQFN